FNPQTSITLKSGSSPAMTLRARRLPKIQILACADQHDEFSGLSGFSLRAPPNHDTCDLKNPTI
ncbi:MULTISPECIES: hypothetical protein, partial [unclassified Novosphingobium]|uniref:hypothetical protein n=1 Tax=unclassified Novosphingobium TaxID=2644732 RepID=UPI001F20DE4B